MDIDDILREADPSFEDVAQGSRDLQALTRAWVAERSSPEILEYDIRFFLFAVANVTSYRRIA